MPHIFQKNRRGISFIPMRIYSVTYSAVVMASCFLLFVSDCIVIELTTVTSIVKLMKIIMRKAEIYLVKILFFKIFLPAY